MWKLGAGATAAAAPCTELEFKHCKGKTQEQKLALAGIAQALMPSVNLAYMANFYHYNKKFLLLYIGYYTIIPNPVLPVSCEVVRLG